MYRLSYIKNWPTNRGAKYNRRSQTHSCISSSVVNSIKEKYRNSNHQKNRLIIANKVSSKLLRKYRLKFACKQFAFNRCIKILEGIDYERKVQRNRRVEQLKINVKTFLQRDNNSRTTTGKKETITRHKIKKQKRYLCYSLMNLHAKYNSKNPHNSLSYSFFCKLKPFWVL